MEHENFYAKINPVKEAFYQELIYDRIQDVLKEITARQEIIKNNFYKAMIKKHCYWHQRLFLNSCVFLKIKPFKVSFINLIQRDDMSSILKMHTFSITTEYGIKINGKEYWMNEWDGK